MLALSEIQKFYPEYLRSQKRFLLREYLQHKILQIIYDSDYADGLIFLGGTCLRIVYGNERFSEDIDFDNVQINEADFEAVAKLIQIKLAGEGYLVEMKTVFKGAFHCYIRLPGILYDQGLSGYPEEKILIQLDTEPQHFNFTPEKFLLNRFDVFTQIFITPKDMLLSQKFYAVLNRPRNKGRDFFDIVFLLSLINTPNYDYLKLKLDITTAVELKQRILEKCASISMEDMAKDVAPFLFHANDAKKIIFFADYISQVKLE